jgi:hypothetical protein
VIGRPYVDCRSRIVSGPKRCGLLLLAPATVSPRLGRLLQTTLRTPGACLALSRFLHPPCCHLQPPAGLFDGWPSHVSLEGFSASQPKAADDAASGGVPTPLPLASASDRLCSHSQFRLSGQPPPRRVPATLFSVTERCGADEPSGPPHAKDSSGSRFLDLPALWWTYASDRKAHRGPDPTPFSAPSSRMCRMKPQRPARTHPRVSTRTSFVRLLGLLPSYFHSRHEPSHARSTHKTRPDLQPTPSFILQRILARPRVSPQPHSNPIASVAPAASFKSLY